MEINIEDMIYNDTGDVICVSYVRGSKLYGTSDEHSDTDILLVVKDDANICGNEYLVTGDDSVKVDRRIRQFTVNGDDYEVVKYSDFISLIDEQNPLALEAIFSIIEHSCPINDKFVKDFRLDKWKLRQNFGSIANNSFVKAKKKLTVKESYDHRCAIKSLFHSIRLLMFACQIAEYGKINDFGCSIPLWKEIKDDADKGFKWEDFKMKYKPIWNEWHSKMVKLCPRPKEYFKNNK